MPPASPTTNPAGLASTFAAPGLSGGVIGGAPLKPKKAPPTGLAFGTPAAPPQTTERRDSDDSYTREWGAPDLPSIKMVSGTYNMDFHVPHVPPSPIHRPGRKQGGGIRARNKVRDRNSAAAHSRNLASGSRKLRGGTSSSMPRSQSLGAMDATTPIRRVDMTTTSPAAQPGLAATWQAGASSAKPYTPFDMGSMPPGTANRLNSAGMSLSTAGSGEGEGGSVLDDNISIGSSLSFDGGATEVTIPADVWKERMPHCRAEIIQLNRILDGMLEHFGLEFPDGRCVRRNLANVVSSLWMWDSLTLALALPSPPTPSSAPAATNTVFHSHRHQHLTAPKSRLPSRLVAGPRLCCGKPARCHLSTRWPRGRRPTRTAAALKNS